MRRNFRLLIPAAGESRRFREAGHSRPKPALPIAYGSRVQTMLEWVLGGVPTTRLGPTIVGAHPDLGLSEMVLRPHVRVPVSSTRGQADTLRQMIEAACPNDAQLLIVNADVVFTMSDVNSLLNEIDFGGADTATMVVRVDRPDLSKSYVSSFPWATGFAEKDPISSYAVAGAWAFRSSTHLWTVLQYVCNTMQAEPYLSHAMDNMRGCHACCLAEHRVMDWGTPEEIERHGARIVT